MAMTRDGPISMCIHNAKRDHFILQPVMVEGEYRGAWWNPLDGTVDGRPTTTIPDPKDHALKRLKGRMRRQVFEDRSQVRSV